MVNLLLSTIQCRSNCILDIRQVLFVLNLVSNLLAVSEEMRINVGRFDDFVLLDRLYLVNLVDMQTAYPMDCLVPMILVRLTMDGVVHENVVDTIAVYCVTMTFGML